MCVCVCTCGRERQQLLHSDKEAGVVLMAIIGNVIQLVERREGEGETEREGERERTVAQDAEAYK